MYKTSCLISYVYVLIMLMEGKHNLLNEGLDLANNVQSEKNRVKIDEENVILS